MIKKIGVDEKTKTPAYLNTETGLVSFGCGKVTIKKEDREMILNETEQGIFIWGLDFLEMQKKNLEAIKRKYSLEVDKKHITTQIQLLDKFIDLLKNKTLLTSWENDPKAQ